MATTSPRPASPSERPGIPGAPVGGEGASAGAVPAEAEPGSGLRIVRWSPDGTTESRDPAALRLALADPAARVWVDLTEPRPELVAYVAAELGLHPLVAEDILERNQRAKVEFTGDRLHLVLFGLRYEGEVVLTELDFVLGERFLLSAHEAAWTPDQVDGMRRGAAPVLAEGVDYLLWTLADGVVDAYFPVLDRMDEELDRLQDDVVDRTDRWTLERLFALKRELIELRRAIVPTRETVAQLTNRQLALIKPEHVVYFRDVYDHVIRATEDLDTLRDLASSTLEVYLSQVNNNLSLIMKRLTGVTVILAGAGAIAGIFGMSEAGAAFAGGETLGFWLVSVGVVGIVLLAAALLRRIGWI